MAGQGKTAEVRVYRTVDGQLVGEGDPRGAFLAYPVGAVIPAGEVDAYETFVAGAESMADRANAGDDEARAELRARLTRDPNMTPLPAGTPVPLMHDRLATELADEQRTLANRGPAAAADAVEAVDDDAVVARHRVFRTETGDLVHEGHEKATTLAYAPGDRVSDADAEQYNDLGDPPAPADADPAETKQADQPANKSRSAARTTRR